MKIPEPKYKLWIDYYIMHNNKVAIFKATGITIRIEDSGRSPMFTEVLYDGFINGNRTEKLPEYAIFPTKEDLLKSLL